MNYYVVKFMDEKTVKYAIYYTDDSDGFVCENGKIIFFDSVESLEEFCKLKNIIISKEKIPDYDFAYLKQWLTSSDEKFDCSVMLDFWNIISDVLRNENIDFLGDCKENEAINTVYNKLFWGCNLIAHHNQEKIYVPEWNAEEIELLKRVLSQYKEFLI